LVLRKRLGMRQLEAQVLDVLWTSDQPLTPREVHMRLPRGKRLAYTTVTTVLARLWKKKILTRRREGRTFTYWPRESRSELAARRMQEILTTSGDRLEVLATFLEAIPAEERAKLRKMLGRRSTP
jgi:predicted transcriptional regulator